MTRQADLVCAFGLPWIWHVNGSGCLLCVAASTEACDAFDEAVRRGEYDAEGFSPAERRIYEKKMKNLARVDGDALRQRPLTASENGR